jgi:hypothetical protein
MFSGHVVIRACWLDLKITEYCLEQSGQPGWSLRQTRKIDYVVLFILERRKEINLAFLARVIAKASFG